MAKDYESYELEHLIKDALESEISEERIIEILSNNLSQVGINRCYLELENEITEQGDWDGLPDYDEEEVEHPVTEVLTRREYGRLDLDEFTHLEELSLMINLANRNRSGYDII